MLNFDIFENENILADYDIDGDRYIYIDTEDAEVFVYPIGHLQKIVSINKNINDFENVAGAEFRYWMDTVNEAKQNAA